MSFASHATRISSRLGRLSLPRSTVGQLAIVGMLMVLVGTAVIIARGEVAQEIAVNSEEVRIADSVAAATVFLGGEISEAVLVGALVEAASLDQSRLDTSVENIRDAAAALMARVALLPAEARRAGLETLASDVNAHAGAVADGLEQGDTSEAVTTAERRLGPALDAIRQESERVSAVRSGEITSLAEGIGTVTMSARYVSALFIPLLVIFIMYRAMQRIHKDTLLRNDLAREKELRRKKDAFVAAASHHINTPLSAVVGFSELLRDRNRDFNAGVRKEFTELLALQAQETASVVDDLLVAAKDDLGELEMAEAPLQLRDVVDEATADWVATQRLRLSVKGNGSTTGDFKWLTHAVRNVLRNAASFGGESIHVEIRNEGRSSVVQVADDGDPVPDGETEQMFQLYHSYRQVEGLAPSLGLGLSVARRICRSMGGDLRYHRLDGWNIFELSIPRSDTTGITVREPPERILDPMRGKPSLESIMDVIFSGGPMIVYQPIVTLSHGSLQCVGYEALSRFEEGTPPEWFEAASTLGIGLDLELSAIRAAIDGFRGEKELFLTVNVADRTLHSSRLLELVESTEPGRLVLELSEAATIKSYEATSKVVETLSARGVRLAVDDIGAGEVDLWHMSRIGAQIIKIDMSLVHRMASSTSDMAMVKGIVAMAREMGATVVAEGVETHQQHALLMKVGVELGQGYLYGRPGPLDGPGNDGAAVNYEFDRPGS